MTEKTLFETYNLDKEALERHIVKLIEFAGLGDKLEVICMHQQITIIPKRDRKKDR